MASQYQAVYRAACAKLKEIESLACKTCNGFGYVNENAHHTAAQDHPDSRKCSTCEGTGFRATS